MKGAINLSSQTKEKNKVKSHSKLTLMEAYVMAVGGMIGGGIFSVLGLVLELSGPWAALAFLIAGILTFISGLSYAGLYEEQKVPGGSVAFIHNATGSAKLAGHVGWALLVGYVFTNGLYAYTFGHYLANVIGTGEMVAESAAIIITLAVVAVNLKGVGESGFTEIVTVWGKLLILGALGIFGLMHFDTARLAVMPDKGPLSALLAAAIIFVAYEGFQLLTYDTEDMENPDKNLRRAMLPSIITSTAVYILISLSAIMLTSMSELIEKKEVALALAGQTAFGSWGLWIVTMGALFSAASAINATIFAAARLLAILARMKQVPVWLMKKSESGLPRRAIIVIGIAGGFFAVASSIEQIVSFASLTFLFVFSVVNFLFARSTTKLRSKAVAYTASALLLCALLTASTWMYLYRAEEFHTAIGIAILLVLARIWFIFGAKTETPN
ncbi:MAG: APC family permease [Cyanobacteriota/Melainabacteria group bacterium]